MKTRFLFAAIALATLASIALPLAADEPIIPPTLSKIWPAGMQRGTTATFTLDGRNISGATEVIFDVSGINGKITQTTDVPEKITGPRAGVDTSAQVPLGKKQTAKLEVSVSKDVEPGLHWFRIHTPLGTSNMVVFAVGALPEVTKPGNAAAAEDVKLPATLIGTIESPGATDSYQFEGKAGEELVFQVMASELGSRLQSALVLRDAAGQVVGQAGENDNKPDAVLTAKLPQDGKYTLSITDREKGGDKEHFYRLNAGALPYITGVFPLGVRAGQASEVKISGINLGASHEVKVNPPQSAGGWTTMPLEIKSGGERSLNKVKLVVNDEPEIPEEEPNDSAAHAQAVSVPVTINGHIDGGAADEDFFRFHAKEGEHVNIEVAAARLGSPLDSLIEILDAQGNPIPRATIRCLNQTTTTLSDRDSRAAGYRLTSMSGFHEGDYLMAGDELNQVAYVPDQPDADIILKAVDGLRLAFLGTTPDTHAVNTTVYRAQILPPDAQFPPNGLPVFHLTWRNDDGGPGYGADSRLDFVAPKEGDYIVRLKDVRGLQGPDYSYRLTLRDASPDYQLRASPDNPNIPKGGSVPVTVVANRLGGYDGPIEIQVEGLPHGISASPATIPQGQESTVLVLTAAQDASPEMKPAAIKIVGHANADGRDLVRQADKDAPLQLASVIPAPDVVVSTEAKEVRLEPGKEVTVTLHVNRQNGFKGRVPCYVENLPPGVRVANVGLNGVLVTETQTSRTFTLKAEDWAKPIRQPIYVVAEVESDSSTMHPSSPLLLKVGEGSETALAGSASENERGQTGSHAPNH